MILLKILSCFVYEKLERKNIYIIFGKGKDEGNRLEGKTIFFFLSFSSFVSRKIRMVKKNE